MKTRILIVDDDKILLNSFRRLFLSHKDKYELLLESKPELVIEFFQNETLDICISDFLMPVINGAELLKKAKDATGCLTILLSGEKLPTDFDNDKIDFILTKPCLPSELLEIIDGEKT